MFNSLPDTVIQGAYQKIKGVSCIDVHDLSIVKWAKCVAREDISYTLIFYLLLLIATYVSSFRTSSSTCDWYSPPSYFQPIRQCQQSCILSLVHKKITINVYTHRLNCNLLVSLDVIFNGHILISSFPSLYRLLWEVCDSETVISIYTLTTYIHYIHYKHTAATDALGQWCSME